MAIQPQQPRQQHRGDLESGTACTCHSVPLILFYFFKFYLIRSNTHDLYVCIHAHTQIYIQIHIYVYILCMYVFIYVSFLSLSFPASSFSTSHFICFLFLFPPTSFLPFLLIFSLFSPPFFFPFTFLSFLPSHLHTFFFPSFFETCDFWDSEKKIWMYLQLKRSNLIFIPRQQQQQLACVRPVNQRCMLSAASHREKLGGFWG